MNNERHQQSEYYMHVNVLCCGVSVTVKIQAKRWIWLLVANRYDCAKRTAEQSEQLALGEKRTKLHKPNETTNVAINGNTICSSKCIYIYKLRKSDSIEKPQPKRKMCVSQTSNEKQSVNSSGENTAFIQRTCINVWIECVPEMLVSLCNVTFPCSSTSLNAGQPQPESYLVSELKRSSRQTMHL